MFHVVYMWNRYGKCVPRTFLGRFFWVPIPLKRYQNTSGCSTVWKIKKSREIRTNTLKITKSLGSSFTGSYGSSGFNTLCASHMYVHLFLLAYTLFWTCVHWQILPYLPYDFSKISKFFWFFFSGPGSLKP